MARPRKLDREEIIDKALAVFRAQGVAGTSLDEVLEAIGIGRGSFYNDFDNKEHLYRETLKLSDQRMMEEGPGELSGPNNGLEAVRAFFDGLVAKITHGRNPLTCYFMNSVLERAGGDRFTNRAATAAFERILDGLDTAIRQGQARGEIRTDIPAEELALTYLATGYGLQVMAKARFKSERIERSANGAMALLTAER